MGFKYSEVLVISSYQEYKVVLEELHSLLQQYGEVHWADYFKQSLHLLYQGKPQKSIAHTLSAYGGMGSFNDSLFFTGASQDVSEQGFVLRNQLWVICKNKNSSIKRLLEW